MKPLTFLKSPLVFVFLFFFASLAQAQFVTRWVVAGGDITIPARDGFSYNYNVAVSNLTNPGTAEPGPFSNQTGSITIPLEDGSTYQVSITGTFDGIYFNNAGDKDEIISVEQWGSNPWGTMQEAFYGCTNLQINAPDAPDLSGLLSLRHTFRGCTSLNQSIESWDVNNIVEFFGTFRDATAFNQPMNGWDMTSATNISQMFYGATNFNQPLDSWVLTGMTDVKQIFFNAASFDQNVESWDVSLVQDFAGTFEGAAAFNQPLNGWDMSSATRIDNMFQDATAFNQPLNSWDVTGVTLMDFMFLNASNFDQDLGSWDVQAVTDMSDVFSNANLSKANYSNTLIGWAALPALQNGVPFRAIGQTYGNDGQVARNTLANPPNNWDMQAGDIFEADLPFITTWTATGGQITIPTTGGGYNYSVAWFNETSPGTGEGSLAAQTGDAVLTGLADGNTYRVEISGDFPRIYFNNTGDKDKILTVQQWGDIEWSSMFHAFYGCTNLTTVDGTSPNLSAVTNMFGMFRGASSFNSNINNWNVGNVTDFQFMFSGASVFNQPLANWNMSNATTLRAMFQNAFTFNQPLDSWVLSTSLTDLRFLFENAAAFNQPLNSWNVAGVLEMEYVFFGATSFDQPLDGWNVSSCIDMQFMFGGSSPFNQDISGWNVSSVASMRGMFNGTTNFNQDISGWNVGAVTDMQGMFFNSVAFNQNLSSWNVSGVTVFQSMFQSSIFNNGQPSGTYTAPLTWTPTSADNMRSMFRDNTVFNQDISTWDVSSVTLFGGSSGVNPNQAGMFVNAAAFDQDLGAWDMSAATSVEEMLDNSGLSLSNYDATLVGWSLQTLNSGLTLGATGLSYSPVGQGGRDILTGTFTWTITGDAAFAPFITTWQTTGAAETVTVPNTGTGYDFTVDWGDGTTEFLRDADAPFSHTYATASTYTVEISGSFPRIFFNSSGDTDKIQTIEQWGDIAWTSMADAFHGCTNLTYNASDAPDLSGVTSLSDMFRTASSFDGAIGNWDVSTITNFLNMFQNAIVFNQPLNTWNVSSGQSFGNMFNNAQAFNQPLNLWNMSSATSTSGMFNGAVSFNGDISTWDVSGITTMANMFLQASNFNQDLSAWDVSGVTSMAGMFDQATIFNGDVTTWVTTSLMSTHQTFKSCPAFNQDISGWDVSNVSTFTNMFLGRNCIQPGYFGLGYISCN